MGAISLVACPGDLDPTSPRGSGLDLDVVQTTGRWLGAVASVLVPIALAWWLLGRRWAIGVAVLVVAVPLWIMSLV